MISWLVGLQPTMVHNNPYNHTPLVPFLNYRVGSSLPIGSVHLLITVPCSSHAILDDRRGGSHNSAVLNAAERA